MPSVVEMCNVALSQVGDDSTIASLVEDSTQARHCKLLYPQARDEVLHDYDWNFAKGSVILADLGSPPTGWLFRYQYPADTIKIRHLIDSNTLTSSSQRTACLRCGCDPCGCSLGLTSPASPLPEFHVRADTSADSKVVVTNLEDAEAIITRAVTNTSLFPPLVVSAIEFRLASLLAIPLTQKRSTLQDMTTIYQQLIESAQVADANEQRNNIDYEPDWITARN